MSSTDSRHRVSQGVRGLARDVLNLLYTRLTLLSVELQEEKLRIFRLFLLAALAAGALAFALLFFALFVVVLLGESYRLLALGGVTLFFTALGLIAGMQAMAILREGSHLFEASLVELKRDQAALEEGHEQ